MAAALAFALIPNVTSSAAAAPNALDLRVLLIGGPGGGASDPTTAAWASGLTNQGVAYTEVDATGAAGAETVTLPALTSSAAHGLYNGVVFADAPSDFAAGQLSSLFAYESTFGVRQVDGYAFPTASLGLNDVSGSALSETATLNAAGLLDFPALAGPVPLDSGTYGYPATVATGLPAGASETPLLTDPSGNVLIGFYQHPSAASDPSDPQAGVQELTIGFDYNATYTQWLLLGPGLIDWVTGGVHLGLYRNYVEMDIDDTFTPDDSWDTTNHTIDYSDADSLRMQPSDVTYAAQWSEANDFRMDQLFNFGSSVVAQQGGLVYDGYNPSATSDPLLAAFQATDPTTGKPYSDDFGWISHTYDTPYLDVGCATTDYIEAELNENTSSIAAAPGATPGTGGLGLTETTNTADALGTEDPQVFVPGNHSGFADLVPGNPATVDPPDLDASSVGTGGTLAAGSYQYAVTDQFNSADSTSTDQSAAYLTDPITVSAGQSVTLNWQAICHASDYLIYREVAGSNDWYYLGTVSTPQSANSLPDSSSGDPTGKSTTDVSGGGELEQSFTDTGAAGTSVPATTADPTTENAVEQPWEQNPNFIPALEAAGITAVGADASKAYPNPPGATFGLDATGDVVGGTYTGATYAAGQTFVDGTAQVVPRHPINIYYNNSTEAQAVDEYNTLYDADWPNSQCVNSTTTTCATTPFTFADIVNQVVAGMLDNMLTNDPEPSYVHQTNIIGSPPGCPTGDAVCNAAPPATAPSTSDTTGDGLLYSVLNPLLAEYHSYYNSSTPYEQLTEGAIATTLAEQSAWTADQPAGTASAANQVVATESGDQVTLTNSGSSTVTVPVTVPAGSTQNGAPFGSAYGGTLSGWVTLAAGAAASISIPLAPSITSAASATAQEGSSFSFTASATGAPTPALSETGALPSGISFTNNGDGTATLAGTPASGSAGSYPITIDANNGVLPEATQAFTLTVDAASASPPPPAPPAAPTPTPTAPTPEQYDLVGSDGGVFVFGQSGGFYGSLPGLGIHVKDIVGIVPTADDKGYFLVGSDGGVFAFGDAPFENSLPGLGIHVKDIVGIVPTADDKGYFLVGSDGGVFAFGDAGFEDSLPGLGVHVHDIMGIAVNATGGYWLVGADGSVYALGNALYLGGLAGASATPIDGIAATRTGNGYWLVGQNGSIYTYNAKFYGSLPALNVSVSNVVGIVPTPDQLGYWLVGSDGGIFAFGDAQEIGSLPGLGIHVTNIVGAVPTS